MIILIIFALLSGVVTILSPCILPMLPIILSGTVGKKSKPYGIVTGFILSFVIFTTTLTFLVDLLNIPSGSLRVISIVVLISFGLIMFIPKLKEQFELLVSKFSKNRQNGKTGNGYWGGIIVGLTLGVFWTPCVGPIMASVIALAATSSVDIGSVFIILAYSVGTAIPMLTVILAGKKIISKFKILNRNPVRLQRFFGLIMILMGIVITFDLDRKFQSRVLELFPQYGTGLTIFENSDVVKQALENRRGNDQKFNFNIEPENGELGYYGKIPEEFPVDTLDKVTVVDFWTYSCVNCVRTIPFLRDWYTKYREYGLEIIGVHTPEFVFERDKKNVDKAIEDLGVTWPVIQDNRYDIWNAFENRYWPSKYFIDTNGNIRYFHFGEGDYKTSEMVIRALLIEAGEDLSKIDIDNDNYTEPLIETETPEIYLGYRRAQDFKSETKVVEDRTVNYIPIRSLENGEWSLSGEWRVTKEYVVPQNSGELDLSFYSKNLFLVVEPERDATGTIEVILDNKSIKVLNPDVSKLYQLIDLEEPGRHNLKLKVNGKLRLFAFTFG